MYISPLQNEGVFYTSNLSVCVSNSIYTTGNNIQRIRSVMAVVKAGQTVILVPKRKNVEIVASIVSVSPSTKLAQIEAIVCLEDFEVHTNYRMGWQK